jgi:predicted TIM-barrel fold metal-dependent hydrolase
MAKDLPYCFPPHPSPRKPAFELPPGTVDAHFHVFGPPELFPWSPPEKRVYTPPAAPFAHYRMLAEHLGIDRGVVVQPMAHGHDNSVTLDAIARSDGRFHGVAKVDDGFDEAALQKLHAGGIRGVRFNLIEESGGSVDLAMFERVIGRIARLGWSITFHLKPEELVEHADWLSKIEIPTIIDHYGRVPFRDGVRQQPFQVLLQLLREPHVWAKISCAERQSALGPPYDDAPPFAHALLAVAPDRLLWGTDWPHSQRFELGRQCDDGDLVDLVPRLLPDAAARRRVLVDNPARLFGFDG